MREISHNRSLREQAVDAIRAEVVSGTIGSGEILSATAVAGRLGVSPTPVREAMLDLANAGLIEPVRNRGYRVVEMHDPDLDEIIELRMMLEVPAMRDIARHADRAALEELLPVVEQIEEAAQRADVVDFLLADRAFHLGLLEQTGNRRLVQIVAQLRDQTRLVGLRALADSDELELSAKEHRPLLEAIQTGDGKRAESLMRAHLKHARGSWAGFVEADGDRDRAPVSS